MEDEKMKAMSDLNKAIDIYIEYFLKDSFDKTTLTEYYNERAYLKSELKDYRGAIQDYEKAISMKVGYASLWDKVYFGKGFCETKIGNFQSAVESYEKVFIHNPKDELAHFNVGLVKIALGRKNEGCLNLSKSGELGYSDAYEIIAEHCN
ncbi:hypothetical protein [Arenibacter sp. ARW7G5Y1]|uniref:tetratricopeptide repeat protein n=1 Tax=Arenibacter sp. ARW7G5Y1 TaxID=2135619 RepID=UPI0011B5D061|nr:hypothetical protein [Arenibacter sp. ARW7G5Y1]